MKISKAPLSGEMEVVKVVILAALCVCIFSAELNDSSDNIIIHLPNGAVKGEKQIGESGNFFYSFKGIPFAEPALGKLRFKPPVPKKPWKDVLDATEDRPPCSQLNFFSLVYEGDEDCLYLNVYTPKLPEKETVKLDVVYHIHGGGFLSLGGNSLYYGPMRFPLDDIVLVSITYRVSALGFLSTNDSVSSGNYGLLDQVEGLRWVRNNIHYFGGDPNKVTILGESAGGASAIYHMLSPLSEGLFHKAIAMSGSPLCQWALQKDPVYWSKKLGKDINCPTKSSEELVECLRQKTAQEVIEKGTESVRGLPQFSMAPTVDNYFIDDTPLKIVNERNYNKNVPLLIGTTKDEGNCWFLGRKDSPNDFTDEEITDLLMECVDFLPNVDEKLKLVKEKYFENVTSYKEEEVRKRLSLAITEGMFHKCIYGTAKKMAKSGTKTYLYRYDFQAPFSTAQLLFLNGTFGVCHADDLFMLFDGLFYVSSFDERSQTMKIKFQKLLTNFIKHGNPVLSDEEDKECEWPQVENDKLSIYHIDEKCSLETYDVSNDPLYNFWINIINNN